MAVQSIWRGQAARKRVGELMGASDAASQAELEEACAVMVQCAWRSRHSRSLVSSLHADRAAVAEAERQYELQEAGAMAVQSIWRGRAARTRMRELESGFEASMRSVAALMVQCWWRGLQASWHSDELAAERAQQDYDDADADAVDAAARYESAAAAAVQWWWLQGPFGELLRCSAVVSCCGELLW